MIQAVNFIALQECGLLDILYALYVGWQRLTLN